MNILIIEDDKTKLNNLKFFLEIEYANSVKILFSQSYQSGLKSLHTNKIDLLLLDMSMPTWDKKPYESGGKFEKFGGQKILKEIKRKNKSIQTILITMFDVFGESHDSFTLHQIDSQLKEEFPKIFLGSIYYNSAETKWKVELKNMIENELKKYEDTLS